MTAEIKAGGFTDIGDVSLFLPLGPPEELQCPIEALAMMNIL